MAFGCEGKSWGPTEVMVRKVDQMVEHYIRMAEETKEKNR